MLCALLDTSGDLLVFGLVTDGGLVAAAKHRHTRENARCIGALFHRFIEQSRFELGQLTHFAIGIGPGTFIGTRTGIAFANGFCVSRQLPMVAVGTLRAAAAGASMRGSYPVCIRSARHNSYYAGIYDTDPCAPPRDRTLVPIYEGEVPRAELGALLQRARQAHAENRHIRILTDDCNVLELMRQAELPPGSSLELTCDFPDPYGMALLALGAIRRGDTVQFADALYFRRPVP